MKLQAARVFVYDLPGAHDFYAHRLGLTLVAGGADAGWLVYDAGGAQLVVEAVAPDAPEDEHALVGRFSGLSFAVDDIDAAFASLVANGVRFAAPPARQAWGGRLATFVDAADNELQLVQGANSR